MKRLAFAAFGLALVSACASKPKPTLDGHLTDGSVQLAARAGPPSPERDSGTTATMPGPVGSQTVLL